VKQKLRQRRIWLILGLFIVALLVGLVLLSTWSAVGASVATPLRRIIGNEAVAKLETALFTAQDLGWQWLYERGLAKPKAPWEVSVAPATLMPPPLALAPVPTAMETPPTDLSTLSLAQPIERTASPSLDPEGSTAVPTSTPTPVPTATPTPSPTPSQWTLPALPATGSLPGEGVWQPYLSNANGQVVGLRTFLQPDATRPQTVVAVVAFDLRRTNLHYVLGSEEPAVAGGPHGNGYLARGDKQPGRLLAAFNGGFLATHGEYGAMADGIIALPPKDRAGTVAIHEDGLVQIGEWDQDISPADNFVAWRQNARMVVYQGQVTERVFNNSIETWGGSLDGAIVTWRSGLGISVDGQILYYFAGPSMSMPALAAAMQAVGAHNGILLDINPAWVHFTAIRADGERLVPEPLFEDGMDTTVDRYLRQSKRDFFYVTAKS
jgi:hypothetical protein